MANYVRCIHYSNTSGEKEGIIFTTDFESEPVFFIPNWAQVINDFETLKESDFPSSFPFEINFEK